jgi:pentapeptide MXKDX repeat protein
MSFKEYRSLYLSGGQNPGVPLSRKKPSGSAEAASVKITEMTEENYFPEDYVSKNDESAASPSKQPASPLEHTATPANKHCDSASALTVSFEANASSLCKICGSVVGSVEDHVISHHRLPAQLYTTLFLNGTVTSQTACDGHSIAGDNVEEHRSKEIDPTAPVRPVGPDIKQEEDAIKDDAIKDDAIKHDAIKDDGIKDGAIKDDAIKDDAIILTDNPNENCLFFCGICHIPVTCLRGHVKRRHFLSPKEYQASFPDVNFKRKTYHRYDYNYLNLYNLFSSLAWQSFCVFLFRVHLFVT